MAIKGAQSSHRLLQLLVRVGRAHPAGIRLRDLAEQTGLTAPTVHRLVSCLLQEGFVERAPSSRRLRLGLEAMQLGLAATRDMPLADRFMPAMKRVARETGDSVFLMMRIGPDALCLHREEGSFPVKVLTVAPGTRRPLGLSGVGLAILALLPDEALWPLFQARRNDYAAVDMPLAALQRLVRAARRDGYVQHTEHRQAETSGVACAARFGHGTYAGLSVAAINSRMGQRRRVEIAALLRTEVDGVLREMAGG
ncbi:MAG: IclR family transcriptional regulator [Burkholderiaceae bacterium]